PSRSTRPEASSATTTTSSSSMPPASSTKARGTTERWCTGGWYSATSSHITSCRTTVRSIPSTR
ncbi:hypothetical protein KEM52_003695, partial [Ascosphaera acerosa]